MKIISILALLLWMFCTSPVMGQEGARSREYAKSLEAAINAYHDFDYQTAITRLQKLLRRNALDADLWMLLSEVSRESGDLFIEDSALRSVIRVAPEKYPQAYLRLADLKHNQGLYEGAMVLLNDYSAIQTGSAVHENSYQRIRRNVEFALEQMADSSRHQITIGTLPSGINTSDDEYFPRLTIDGHHLVFTRQTKSGDGHLIDELWTVNRGGEGWGVPVRLPAPVNLFGKDGTHASRQDGKVMVFTSCNRPEGKGGCDLYLTRNINGEWTTPRNLGYPVNTRYWESTPALHPDGKYLFFSSNRQGGLGGMDIWISTLRSDGTWEEPINAGKEVNTEFDELAPGISLDGKTMFFSSTGHTGMGGVDLFRISILSPWVFDGLMNLGYPINTYGNELGFTSGYGDSIILSSDRNSNVGRDLFVIEYKEGLEAGLSANMVLYGKVVDNASGKPLRADISMQSIDGSIFAKVDSDPVDGLFTIGIAGNSRYFLHVESPGYLFHNAMIDSIYEHHTTVDTLEIRLQSVVDAEAVVLNHVFFDFDSASLLADSYPELDGLVMFLRSNPELKIEVSGHTDNIGPSDYNLDLSKRRARAVIDYLHRSGVQPDRLFSIGFGSERPVVSNDSPAGQQRNRRTEFRIIR